MSETKSFAIGMCCLAAFVVGLILLGVACDHQDKTEQRDASRRCASFCFKRGFSNSKVDQDRWRYWFENPDPALPPCVCRQPFPVGSL